MLQSLLRELTSNNKQLHVSSNEISRFIEWLMHNPKYSRDENKLEHLCVFYVPIDTINKKIYIIIHRKSGLWMPPGGHIDKNEKPHTAIIRECGEELNYKITNENLELFNISIDPIDNPIQQCKVHYSLWYLVDTDHQNFQYNEESLDGRWVDLIEAKRLITFPTFQNPIASLSPYLGI